jgi:hypothetical protein
MRQHGRIVAGRVCRLGRDPRGGKDAQVDTAGVGVTPAQVPGGHDQRAVVAQDLPQVMQLAAQVRQRLRARRFWPERPRDPLPRLRHPGMSSQERDESNRPRRTRRDVDPVFGDGLFPQEGHVQHGEEASRASG